MKTWINIKEFHKLFKFIYIIMLASILIIITILATNSINKILPHHHKNTNSYHIFYTKDGLINDLKTKIDKNVISKAIVHDNNKYIIEQNIFQKLYHQELVLFMKNSKLFIDRNEKIHLDYWYFNESNSLKEIIDYDVKVWNYHYIFSIYYEWDKNKFV